MSFPLKLFRLQQIDTQLDQASNRMREIEKAINENPQLDQAAQSLKEIEKVLEMHQKQLSQAEDTVRAQRTKIEQSESTLYSGKISNPKELQDLQNETIALKRFFAVLEDRQLEAMILLDETREKHAAALSHFQNVSEKVAEENQALLKEQAELQRVTERLSIERQSLINSLNSELITLYQQLRQQKRGIAVAKVTEKTCSACGSSLTPATIQSTHSPNQITYCPSCGRVLYGG